MCNLCRGKYTGFWNIGNSFFERGGKGSGGSNVDNESGDGQFEEKWLIKVVRTRAKKKAPLRGPNQKQLL